MDPEPSLPSKTASPLFKFKFKKLLQVLTPHLECFSETHSIIKVKKAKKNIFGNKSKGKKTFTRILKQNKPKLDNLAFEVVKLTFFKWTTKFYDEDICILLILALRE